MSLGKRDISRNISSKAHIKLEIASNILNSFLEIIKTKSQNNEIKISGFGSFNYKKTPLRIGRNPITKKEYPISSRLKLNFNSSKKVRKIFN